MFPYEEYLNGHVVQSFMLENADYAAYLAFAYLGLVKYGPSISNKLLGELPAPKPTADGKRGKPAPDPEWLRISMIIWNLLLSGFSICGAVVMIPSLLSTLRQHGWHDTVCTFREELNYTTPCGFWMSMFVLSKIPELVDTLWLVLQKRKTPPFLHWYHHVSVLIFAWSSYSIGNSTMPVFGSMNIFVHSIMYFYFAICACGWKSIVRPFAPLITSLQILQMVGGSALTFYSYYVNIGAYQAGITDQSQLPCAVGKSAARFGSLMYLSYLYLFSKMFVNSYLRKPSAASRNGKSSKSPTKSCKAL